MGHVRRRRARDEDGFSLVELIVIVVIIGILAALATVTYLNQRQSAQRASAISALSNTRLVAESLQADDDTGYSDAASEYNAEEPAYLYVDGPSDELETISVHGDDDGEWVSFAVPGGRNCYYLRMQRAAPGLVQHTGPIGATGCHAADFGPGVTGSGAWT